MHVCLQKSLKNMSPTTFTKKNGARFAEVGYCCFSSHTTVEPWHPIRFYLCAPGKEHNHRLKLFPGLLPRHIIFLGLSIVAPSWFRLVAVHPSPEDRLHRSSAGTKEANAEQKLGKSAIPQTTHFVCMLVAAVGSANFDTVSTITCI